MVPKVFQWYLAGEGPREIAKRLNSDGHCTRSGKPWTKQIVYSVLRNETYTGMLVWNRYSKAGGRKVLNLPEEVVRLPHHHPALVDAADFRRVQALLDSRAPVRIHPREVASVHILSGLVFCKRCGSKMVVSTAKSGRFTYYACQRKLKRGTDGCDHKMINTRKLEGFVVNVIKQRILTETNVSELLVLISEELRTGHRDAARELASIERQLVDTDRRLGKLYRLIEDEKLAFDEAAPRLRELTASRQELEKRKAELTANTQLPAPKALPRAAVRRYVEDLHDTIRKGSIAEQKTFLRSFVSRIDVDYPIAELKYTCPLVPPGGVEPLSGEVLCMGKNGSPGRTRTYNPAVTRVPFVTKGLGLSHHPS